VIWVIITIAIAGVALMSLQVVPPLVAVGLILVAVVAAVAVADWRDRSRSVPAQDAITQGTPLDHAARAERRWHLPGVGGSGPGSPPGDGGAGGSV
jgi:hypothetical protein